MSTLKFRIAAKTDMGLVRTNNEDNFQAAADLSAEQMRWVNNETYSLGNKGALLVVADGMGGMNAGEVASALAIETVREYFTPQNITDEVVKTRFTIEKFMNEVIIAADQRIKQEAKEHPESRGMGTTIVIGWIFDGKLYVSWCGDSRAYIYNKEAGLHQITKDHSYVQGLVDKGSISREDAFDFPDSNIITRSLCDGGPKAKPESLMRPYELCNGDIVMLCTDGLCGMIRDIEIESIIRNNEQDMSLLVDDLIKGACDAEGADNVTICLCQILEGGAKCNPDVFIETEKRLNGKQPRPMTSTVVAGSGKNGYKRTLLLCVIVALLIGGGATWYFMSKHEKTNQSVATAVDSVKKDSVPNEREKTLAMDSVDEGKAVEEEEVAGCKDSVDEKKGKSKNNKNGEKKVDPKQDDKPDAKPTDTNGNNGFELTPVNPKDNNDDGELTPINQDKKTNGDKTKGKNIGTKSTHVVQKGETYTSIAKKYGVNQKDLISLNHNKTLIAGAEIKIPSKK